MTVHRATVIIPMKSGVPADTVTNTWYFQMGVGATLTGPETAIQTFYESIHNQMGTTIDGTLVEIKWVNMADTPPRVPVREASMPFSTPTADPLPHECAAVLSFEATPVNGVNQQSRRGRVYLGPLATGTNVSGRIGVAQTLVFKQAAEALLATSQAASDWDWVVYSTKLASDAVVVGGWVDNAFDTQRRRGIESSARDNWPDAPGRIAWATGDIPRPVGRP